MPGYDKSSFIIFIIYTNACHLIKITSYISLHDHSQRVEKRSDVENCQVGTLIIGVVNRAVIIM